jgi:hypothetical protein
LKRFENNVQGGIELISQIENKEEMSVITFAMHHRACKLVAELLTITDIMKVDGFDETVYDVTDLVPEKEKSLLLESSSSKTKNPKGSQIAPIPQEKEEESSREIAVFSYTEFAANKLTKEKSNVMKLTQSSGQEDNTGRKTLPNEENLQQKCFMVKLINLIPEVVDGKIEVDSDVVELFESNPVKLFVTNTYWKLLLVRSCIADLHLTHMFLFAAYALPNANELAVQTSCVRLPERKHAPAVFAFGQRLSH